MAEDGIQLEDLVNALEREKSTENLCEIHRGFYADLREYLDELKERVDEIEEPRSTRSQMVQREYNKAEKMAERLLTLRMKKIVLSSVHHCSGARRADSEEKDMTEAEDELFEDVTELLKKMKNQIFYGGYKRSTKEEDTAEISTEGSDVEVSAERTEVVDKRSKDTVEEIPSDKDITEKRELEKQGDVKSELDERLKEEDIEDEEMVEGGETEGEILEEILVQIVEDVPPFVDLQTSYNLEKNDVVTLRRDIADVLISRDKARKVELN